MWMKMENLGCTQVLIDITSKGCTKLRIHVVVININNSIICIHICQYISAANILYKKINKL